jgi:sialidase-1
MNKIIKFFAVSILISFNLIAQDSRQIKSELSKNITTLFSPGEANYNCFRIPAVVLTNDGSILAFAEARVKSCSDTGNIDLVMKKSTNNGKSWSDLIVIWNDGQNVCGNPAPLVDYETGAIHLLATWNSGEDHESQIIEGTSKNSREVYQLVSDDDGNTWSKPKNITATTKLKDWTWYATGPVHGIQLKKGANKGRLLIACDHIEADSKKYYSHVIYSDDHGKSWNLGGRTPRDEVNECTIVELENGDLYLNMRNYQRKELQARQVAISRDGGLTWIHQRIDSELPEPRCQGAILSVERKEKQVLLFTNPSNAKKRINMTLSVSRDQGNSWSEKITIFEGYSAYSDLVELKNNKILVLFEAGIDSPYEGIYYSLVSLK